MMDKVTESKMIKKLKRQYSAPAISYRNPVTLDDKSEDESEMGVLDYNEEVYYGWLKFKGDKTPAPVQVKRPTSSQIRSRPTDKLHLAVWEDDPAKIQKLVVQKGKSF